eukprot:563611-Pyramimonas_sp.AAC.1
MVPAPTAEPRMGRQAGQIPRAPRPPPASTRRCRSRTGAIGAPKQLQAVAAAPQQPTLPPGS